MRHDCFIHVISGHPNRVTGGNVTQRNNGNLCGTATDVDHHGTPGLFDWKPGTQRGSHRLRNQIDPSRPSTFSRIDDRIFFDCSNSAWYRDDHPWAHDSAAVYFPDEIRKHGFGDLKIADHTITKWTNGRDRTRRFADHLFGSPAHRISVVKHLAGVLMNGNH